MINESSGFYEMNERKGVINKNIGLKNMKYIDLNDCF